MNSIYRWFVNLYRVWRRECYLVFKDAGVILFFFALPLFYPIVYTLIYNPEVVTDIPVAVVDNCRSAESRDLVRKADATEAIEVAGYATDLQEARRWMNEHRVYAIMEIPADYSRQLGGGGQAIVPFYSDMSLLLRYRALLMATTDLQMATGTEFRAVKIDDAGLVGETAISAAGGNPVNQQSIILGDTTQGFASFVIPGILVLILQQSMILGIVMLWAGASERRRRNHGFDPLAVEASPGATILGKMFCYVLLYLPLMLYVLHIIPMMFTLPHVGNIWDYLLFILPMMIATAFMGMTLSVFVTGREASMPVIVFTSVLFLFLSGLLWPRYAMNGFWQLVGDAIPAVWGVEGFVRLNSNGSILAEQSHPYRMLWVLSIVYFVTAYILQLYIGRRRGQLSVSH